MCYNLKNARNVQKWKKHAENIKMAKFEAPPALKNEVL